jgi:hypothetical protein
VTSKLEEHKVGALVGCAAYMLPRPDPSWHDPTGSSLHLVTVTWAGLSCWCSCSPCLWYTSGRAEEWGRGCHRAVVRRRSSQGVGFVHRRCCVNGGAEGGAVLPEAPREEVPPLVMEEVGGVGCGAGCGWWAQSGYGGWVHAGCVRKTLCFWQKRSTNCDFYSRSTFLVITQHDWWVQR